MPWSVTSPVDERARFVLEALEGWSSVSQLCETYGISRRIGYKWLRRYEQGGLRALEDRSRARKAQAAATPPPVVGEIVALRQQHPTWGPRKLRKRLSQLSPQVAWPAPSTIGEILRKEGLTQPRRRRRPLGLWRTPRTEADGPNRVWTADYKGEFRLGCGRLCYPLTVVDAHSRYLLACRALPGTGCAGARATFERIFQEYGLPDVIRTDNGVPFSSVRALGGLSQLAVWWMRLGIGLERTRRRHPEDNGAHERMHRTLKAEATRPARETAQQQQRAFERFRQVYNEERPHEALGQLQPASVYRPSLRRMPPRLPRLNYPEGVQCRHVSTNGEFRWQGKVYFLSSTLVGQVIGLQHTHDGRWNVLFGPAHLAVLDEVRRVLRPAAPGRRTRKQSGLVLPM